MEIGDKVLVKENAFSGSDEPGDIAARGKIGVVVWIEDDGRIEVAIDDGEFLPLTVDEVEVIDD